MTYLVINRALLHLSRLSSARQIIFLSNSCQAFILEVFLALLSEWEWCTQTGVEELDLSPVVLAYFSISCPSMDIVRLFEMQHEDVA